MQWMLETVPYCMVVCFTIKPCLWLFYGRRYILLTNVWIIEKKQIGEHVQVILDSLNKDHLGKDTVAVIVDIVYSWYDKDKSKDKKKCYFKKHFPSSVFSDPIHIAQFAEMLCSIYQLQRWHGTHTHTHMLI